jgi:hypothetical protein
MALFWWKKYNKRHYILKFVIGQLWNLRGFKSWWICLFLKFVCLLWKLTGKCIKVFARFKFVIWPEFVKTKCSWKFHGLRVINFGYQISVDHTSFYNWWNGQSRNDNNSSHVCCIMTMLSTPWQFVLSNWLTEGIICIAILYIFGWLVLFFLIY